MRLKVWDFLMSPCGVWTIIKGLREGFARFYVVSKAPGMALVFVHLFFSL